MWEDPIVEEIHAVRRRIAGECGYDLTRIMDLLRRREAEHAARQAPPRRARKRRSVPVVRHR